MKKMVLLLLLSLPIVLIPAPKAHAIFPVEDLLNWVENLLTRIEGYIQTANQYEQIWHDVENLKNVEMQDLWAYEEYSTGEFNWDQYLYAQRNDAISYSADNFDDVWDELFTTEAFGPRPFVGEVIQYKDRFEWEQEAVRRLRSTTWNSFDALRAHNNRLVKGIFALVKLRTAVDGIRGAERQARLNSAMTDMLASESMVQKQMDINGQNAQFAFETFQLVKEARYAASVRAGLSEISSQEVPDLRSGGFSF